MKVGTKVMLRQPLLDNPAGAQGVCTQEYTLNKRDGWFILFENGNYDGFSPEEVNTFLIEMETMPLDYHQTTVMQLSRDFEAGKFKQYLKGNVEDENE